MPDSILAWYRKLVARKFGGSKARRSPGRPRIRREVEQLIVRMAEEAMTGLRGRWPIWGMRSDYPYHETCFSSRTAPCGRGCRSGWGNRAPVLARALARDPAVLFLDEPTASLDPAATKAIEDVVHTVSKRGIKVVMSTHDIGEA